MLDYIIHPDTRSKFSSKTEHEFIFEDQTKLPIHNGTPILLSSDSMFIIDDIINSRQTAQNVEYLDTRNLHTYIRRKILPSLVQDFNLAKRYDNLSKLLPRGSQILIIGVGDLGPFYIKKFEHCNVITSDVHDQFRPDYVFDGHFIPVADNTFDMVLAAQVIEHTINPWRFCQEMQRVTKIGGLLQIEAPQNYPYHAEPYDFFRFTFTGMRSLFPQCKVIDAEITEGNASMVAVSISKYLINTSSIKIVRSGWVLVTRILFGWMKYLDKLQPGLNRRTVTMPKGYAFTFKKDAISRKPTDMFDEFHKLKK